MSARGYFAIGVYHPKTEVNVGSLYRTANLYGAAFVFTVGLRYQRRAADTMNTPQHKPLFHFEDLSDLIKHLPFSAPLVGVELDPRARMLRARRSPTTAGGGSSARSGGTPSLRQRRVCTASRQRVRSTRTRKPSRTT
jgi:hypothetical protein